MSYEIKIHGRMGPALRALAQREIERALAQLRSLKTADASIACHQARKRIKKLRAVLALLRVPLGKKRLREETAPLRQISRALGAFRDASAQRKTLDRLQRRFFTGAAPAFVRVLRAALLAAERRHQKQLTRARKIATSIASLAAMSARLPGWPVDDFGWKELCRAVRRSYQRARRSYEKAHDAPTAQRLHRWRRQVKELGLHVCLLRRVCPALMTELAQEFSILGEFLGDDHDLVVLRGTIEGYASDALHQSAAETLLELIDLRREELLDAAFDLGARLHEDAPAVFARELNELRTRRRKQVRQARKLTEQLSAAD